MRLILVGEGTLRGALQAQIAALGLENKVTLLGRRDDVAALNSAFDAAALPSLHEGLPTVALEWQSAGLPVLLADGIRRDCALTDSVRFVPAAAQDWARALEALKPAPDRAKASAAAIEALRAAGYDLASCALSLQALYQSLTEGAK